MAKAAKAAMAKVDFVPNLPQQLYLFEILQL